MTMLTWFFLTFLTLALLPLGWLAGKLVGMERATFRRAAVFAALTGVAAGGAMWAIPFDIFVLKALGGLLAALAVSPLAFRALMTDKAARAILAALLLAAACLAITIVVLLI